LAAFYNTYKGPSESKAKPLHYKTVRQEYSTIRSCGNGPNIYFGFPR
jgi:hypothetical protein